MARVPSAVSLLLSTSLIAGFVASAYAEDNKLDEIVVTGSRLPTKPGAVAAKITTVDADAIQQAGVTTNVMEILRKALPSFEGRSNTGNSNANNTNQRTAGGASVQLRNLDTLILINGRRSAVSAIAAVGGKSFVDINQIPPSAVDHIEVLSDGASAIYGSDAIGGVVNIILKSGYEGGEAGFRYGSGKGGYNEESSYFTAGTHFDGLKVTVTGSQSRNSPLFQNKRSFSSPITGVSSVVPGTIAGAAILAPNLNAPSGLANSGVNATAPNLAALIANGTYNAATTAAIGSTYDVSQFQTILLKQNNKAANLDLQDELNGKKLVFFGDIDVSDNKSFTQMLPITRTVTVPVNAPYNPTTASFPNVNFAYWPLPKQVFNKATSERIVAGLRGDLGEGWSWEAAYVHSKNDLTQKYANVLFIPNIAPAIAGGFDASGNAVTGGAYSKVFGGFSTSGGLVLQPALNPFARAGGVNPASLSNIYGTEVIDMSSYLNSFDATLVGTAFELPAGKMGFAFGLSHRQEGYSAHTDANGTNTGPTAQLWAGGDFFDAYDKSRTINAAFLEVKLPLTSEKWNLPGFHAFDLITALRQENYSDSDNSLVPKVGFRWQPVDQAVTIRGSVGKSFTAPPLYRLNGPTANRIGGPAIITNTFGLANPGFQAQDGNNPNLKSSKSNTAALSLTYISDAVPGLSMSAEYTDVRQNGFPGGIGFNNILQSVNNLGSASPFASNIAMGNFPGLPGATPFVNPGDLRAYLAANPNNALNTYLIDRFSNTQSLRVKAWSLTGQYQLPTATGTYTLATTGTVFQSFKYQALSSQNYYEFSGTSTNGGGAQGSLPKYRFYTTLNWDYKNWDVTLGNTYASATIDQGTGGFGFATSTTLKPITVNRYLAWDARVAYTAEGLLGKYGKDVIFALGANNLTNVMPPRSAQAFSDNNADVSSYSPIGRLVYASVTMKF